MAILSVVTELMFLMMKLVSRFCDSIVKKSSLVAHVTLQVGLYLKAGLKMHD